MDPPRNIQPLLRRKGNDDFEGYNVRNQFPKYFYSREGHVAWQLVHIERVNSIQYILLSKNPLHGVTHMDIDVVREYIYMYKVYK